jgi:hypothetical protein
MHRSVILVATGFALTSCMSFPYVYSQPGHDYRLSWSELAEISRLAAQRHDILKPIDTIGMLGPDYAQVTSGHPERDGDPTTAFYIRKKAGRWTIEEARVTATSAVFTD